MSTKVQTAIMILMFPLSCHISVSWSFWSWLPLLLQEGLSLWELVLSQTAVKWMVVAF